VVDSLLTQLHDFLLALRRMPQLVITSVHGLAAGAGFSLAFMGDLCIAADDARFRPAYAALGVSPDGGGTVGVAGVVGPRRALQIVLGMDELSALDAHALGLVTRRAPVGDLEAETMGLASRIAAMNPEVVVGTKRLVYQATREAVEVQLEAEREQLLRCMTTPEFRAAVSRFVERSDR
jgi:enoyl-CoA hydratase/carnithine racemase